MSVDRPWDESPAVQRPARRRTGLVIAVVALLAAVAGSLVTLAVTDGDPAPAATTPAGGAATTAPPAPTEPLGTGTVPDWVELAERVGPSVVAIDVRTRGGAGQGSGVILGEEGRIVTNHHVVAGGVELVVTLWDGRLYPASIVGTDVATDLAVIVLDDPPDDLQPAELGDSDAVRVGDPVAAFGNPLGLSHTMTTGVVSALDRPVTTQGTLPGQQATYVTTNAIQVDAAINPGNSGGPLFDAAGRVIGINSSIASMPTGAGGSAGSIGLGFAIPSNLVRLIGEQLAANGSAEHGYIGVGLTDAVATVDGESRAGARVATVEPGSPGEAAGLTPGDVVVAIDGERVTGADSLVGFVRQYPSGAEVTLTVVTDGAATDVAVSLATREDALP